MWIHGFLRFRDGGNCTKFANNSRSCQRILVKFISNKPFDFGDFDPGICNEILPLRDRGKCENFAGSATLAEVFGLRVLLPAAPKSSPLKNYANCSRATI